MPPATTSGRDRETLRRALGLLAQAGYEVSNGACASKATGQPFTFEIMTTTRDQERIALAYARDLKRAGIAPSVRVVDAVQFDQRRLAYDFDMIQNRWDQSLSPGNEQAFYFGSAAADNQGTRNYMGVKSAAVDAMIAAMLETRDRSDFVAAVRALDRVLMSGFYVIPVFNVPSQWLGRWTRVERPKRIGADRQPSRNLVAGAGCKTGIAIWRIARPNRWRARLRSTICSAAASPASRTPTRSPIRSTRSA